MKRLVLIGAGHAPARRDSGDADAHSARHACEVLYVVGGLYGNGAALDVRVWAQQFLQQWPIDSDAHASYWQRIAQGPAYEPADALHTSED